MPAIQNRSAQRDAVLELLRSVRCHPTAGWLYETLRKNHPKISRGTVYRNLDQLCENGLVLRLQSSDRQEHYDANVLPHEHFCCRICDAVHDVTPACDVPVSEGILEKEHLVEKVRLIFHGICKNCREK